MMNFEKKKPGETVNVFSWNKAMEEIENVKKILARFKENTAEIIEKLKEIGFLFDISDTEPSFSNLYSYVIGYIEKSVKGFQDGKKHDPTEQEIPNHHKGFPIGYDNAVNQANPIPRRNGIGDQSSMHRSPAEPPGARMMALGGIKLDMPRKTATEILNEDIKKMLPGKPFVKKAKVKENNDK